MGTIGRRAFLARTALTAGAAGMASVTGFGPLLGNGFESAAAAEDSDKLLVNGVRPERGYFSGVLQAPPTSDNLRLFAPRINPEPFDLPVTPGTPVYKQFLRTDTSILSAGDEVSVRLYVPNFPPPGELTYQTLQIYANVFFGHVVIKSLEAGALQVLPRAQPNVTLNVELTDETETVYDPADASEQPLRITGTSLNNVGEGDLIWLFASSADPDRSMVWAHRVLTYS